ncbi:hypothetical protein [Dickeya oryzae]|uniref:hypothetical protein n=1 Tax=Dickeya oryzae TaxID=1240404 RepID=UPI001F17DD30|nr:hypothetical protein [Dickeya oryzae]
MDNRMKIFLCLTIFLGKIILDVVLFPGFTVDSWTYYDLSKVVFSGYEPSFIRQYQYNSTHSPSFPFFYPLLIQLADKVLNIGIYSSLVLNVFLLMTCCIVLNKMLNRLKLQQEYIIMFSFLLLYPPFFQEVAYGRSMPLATLELMLIGNIFISQQYLSTKKLFIIGLIFSASILTRFEFIILFAIFSLWVLFKEKNTVGKLLFLAPPLISAFIWTIYSERYFNTLWVTESSKLILMPPNIGVLDYAPTIEIGNWLAIAKNIIIKEIKTFTSFILWGVASPLFIIFSHVIYKRISHNKKILTIKKHDYVSTKLLFITITISSVVPIIGLTGYTDGRYFFNLYLFISIFLLYTIAVNVSNNYKITMLCLTYAIIFSSVWTVGRVVKKNILDEKSQEYITAIEKQGLRQCIEEYNVKRILFITANGFEQASVSEQSIKSTALYLLSPSNIDVKNINNFIRDYNIDAIYSKNSILTDLRAIQCTNNLHVLIK